MQLPYEECLQDYWDAIPEPVQARSKWVAFFRLFADESGKLSGKSDYTALCGYVGAAMEWQKLSFMWQQCCLKWGVPPIHMSKIMRDEPDDPAWAKVFKGWQPNWLSRRDDMLEEFAQLIFNSNVVAVGTVIDARAYREVQRGPKYKFPIDDSNVFLFQELITGALDRLSVVDESSSVSVTVDDDQDTAFQYYQMLKSLKANGNPKLTKIRERVVAISFGDDRAYPGIQAADMIAYESRRVMIDRLTRPEDRPSRLYHWLTHGGLNQTKLLDAELLRRMAAECTRRMDELDGQK